jgi:LemA protein
MKKTIVIPLVILALLILYFIATYNSLIKKEEKVKQDWSELQNTYQRRLDLIPNLVSVVKGVSEFEKSVLQKVAEARSNAAAGVGRQEVTAENYLRQKQLQDSLAVNVNRLILLIEAYPELKATKAYLALQDQLAGTERRIVVAAKDFNESVYNYNKTLRVFPTSIVAGITGFKQKVGFESVAGAEKPIEVKFNK